jgi:trans-aconitate 2-methyltransferase
MARSSATWDPAQYLRFGNERLRPALDLLAQIPLAAPARVVDLGCGPGNVTTILRQRFPDADIVGVDGSESMLAKARTAAPDCSFERADFLQWQPRHKLDLIYSNAALQWVDRHSMLFARLLSFLAPGGVLAVQMPNMHAMPLHQTSRQLAATPEWSQELGDVVPIGILPAMDYWDMLRPQVASLEMWQTTYMHALQGENAVMEWVSGSGLRPYLDRLTDGRRSLFRQAYADAVRSHYPPRADGTTILPFQRLFIVATMAA